LRDFLAIFLAKIFEVKSFFIIAFQYLSQYLFVCTFYILARARVKKIGIKGKHKRRVSDTEIENKKNFFVEKSWHGNFIPQTLTQSQKTCQNQSWQNLGNFGKYSLKTRKLRTFPVSESILASKINESNI